MHIQVMFKIGSDTEITLVVFGPKISLGHIIVDLLQRSKYCDLKKQHKLTILDTISNTFYLILMDIFRYYNIIKFI